MVLSLIPVTGVTLPLMSYGGSSILTVMVAIGLLVNISMRRTVF
jgi:rod shape determining protein RodA